MRQTKDADPFSEEVRQALLAAMELQGFNRHTLCQASGVAYTTIMRILNADISPRMNTVGQLFRAMSVTPHFTFG